MAHDFPKCPHLKCDAIMTRAYILKDGRDGQFIPHHWFCLECGGILKYTLFEFFDKVIQYSTQPISGNKSDNEKITWVTIEELKRLLFEPLWNVGHCLVLIEMINEGKLRVRIDE